MIGQASWISSVINLVNTSMPKQEDPRSTIAYIDTVVGAGILAMPLAMSRMGIILGTIIILWAGLTAGFGLYLQTKCARYLDRGASSFFALSQITYPNAAVIFDAAIAIKCFGVGVSYLIIIGDLMPGVVRGFSEDAGGVGFLVDRHFWVTAFMWALRITHACCFEPWLINSTPGLSLYPCLFCGVWTLSNTRVWWR